jgi:hypothetical protein
MATGLPDELLVFNGIDATTGDYLLPPLPAEKLARLVRGERPDAVHAQELKRRARRLGMTRLGAAAKVKDPNQLGQAGWGVIFARDTPQGIVEALRPLLQFRSRQAGPYYREYTGEKGYQDGESSLAFLTRHGASTGPADPDKVPYYLMIVGDPETIPYRFQYHLDVQYAVGRIHFEAPQDYANYAQTVVEAETGPLQMPRTAAFFGTANLNDPATQLSARELVAPLAQYLSRAAERGCPDWQITSVLGEDASKARLAALLGGAETPTFLFTATHGIAFPQGDTRQLKHQGALLCQDWPGPTARGHGPLSTELYFSADDIACDAQVCGRIAFLFACYGAGTPRQDYFAHLRFGQRTAIAPCAFVARLPQRLLGHSKGGALAVVGHVERAWGYSFRWRKSGPQLQTFESTLDEIFAGARVGYAMEFFNQRYAELSTQLSETFGDMHLGDPAPDDEELAQIWTATNDARSYVVIGDPAVRLPVESP